jgi:hypothetical protein
MKKATPEMVTMTLEEVRKRKLPRREIEQLKNLAAMPDEQIDTSDIQELAGFSGGVRGRFYRPAGQCIILSMRVDSAFTFLYARLRVWMDQRGRRRESLRLGRLSDRAARRIRL